MIEDPRCSNVTIKHFCTRLLSDLTAMEKTPFGENTGMFELQHFFVCKLFVRSNFVTDENDKFKPKGFRRRTWFSF